MSDNFVSRWGMTHLDDRQYLHAPGWILRNMQYFIHVGHIATKDDGGHVQAWERNDKEVTPEYGTVVGITDREWRFISHVMAFHYDVQDGAAKPSIGRIADLMDRTERSVYSIIESLVDKGALVVIPQFEGAGRTTSIYDFSVLTKQCYMWEIARKSLDERVFSDPSSTEGGEEIFRGVHEEIFRRGGEDSFRVRIRTINKNYRDVTKVTSFKRELDRLFSSSGESGGESTVKRDDSEHIQDSDDVTLEGELVGASEHDVDEYGNAFKDLLDEKMSGLTFGKKPKHKTKRQTSPSRQKTEKEKRRDEWTLAYMQAIGMNTENINEDVLWKNHKPEMKQAATLRKLFEGMFPDHDLQPNVLLDAKRWMLEELGYPEVGYNALRKHTSKYIEQALDQEQRMNDFRNQFIGFEIDGEVITEDDLD